MNEIKYTHRTKNGMKARIVATDRNHFDYPVVALVWDDHSETERIMLYTSDLKNDVYGESHLDLIPYHPWDDVEPDTKVWVRDYDGQGWKPKHFSHFDHTSNRVHVFLHGTSWSSRGETIGWVQARLASEFDPTKYS